MTRNISRLGRPEYAGAMEFRFFEVDITNYDADANGDGESFDETDAGMSRFQDVECEVVPNGGSGAANVVNAVAQYDYENSAIRLYYGGVDGGSLSEVTSNADEGAVVRVKAIGR